jgi:hypothetical protein
VRRTAVLVVLVVGIFARTDAADSLNCRLVGRYDLDGFTAIALSGNIAYVSNHYRSLYILDVSDPTAPFELGRLDAAQYLKCVVVWGDLVCLGGDSMSGFLWIVDVSDPRKPYVVGYYSFPWGIHIEGDFVLSGDYAFVPAGRDGLRILRMKPQAPYEVGYWDGLGATRGVALSGNLAYVTDYDSGLQILDVSDPRAPYELGRYSLPGFTLSVVVAGDFAYVAGLDPAGKLWVIDVSNPREPYQVGGVFFPGTAKGIAVSGDFVYVVSRQGLYVIDVSDPPNPHLAGWYVNVKGYGDLVVSGELAYTPGLDIIEFLGEGVEESERPEPRRLTLEVGPNPARGLARVSCPTAVTQVSVYDALGRLAKSLKPQEGRATLSGISAGLYLLKAEANGRTLSAKLVMR